MIAIINRNLKIYFRNKGGVLGSILGSLIVFLIYILFTRNMLMNNDMHILHQGTIMDLWMMSALLTTTSLTTAFTTCSQLVSDRSQNKLMDFMVTETSNFKILLGYVLSTAVVSFIMQVIAFVIGFIYTRINEYVSFNIHNILLIIFIMFISAILSSVISLTICMMIKSETVTRPVSGILSALVGFLIGGYVPIGELSNHAQTVIKFFPLTYSSVAFRQIMMAKPISDNSKTVQTIIQNLLGVNIKVNKHITSITTDTTIMMLSVLAFILIILCLSRKFFNLNSKD